MVWSVCAAVNEDGRKKIDTFLRDLEKVFPITDTVYHYYVDTSVLQFRHWNHLLHVGDQWTYNAEYKPEFLLREFQLNAWSFAFFRLPFFKIIVPTIDTVRYNYIVEAYRSMEQPVLLVGPVGTGKTSTVKKALDALDKNKFLLLTISMSAHTTTHNVQDTIAGRLEKRTKDQYVPQAST